MDRQLTKKLKRSCKGLVPLSDRHAYQTSLALILGVAGAKKLCWWMSFHAPYLLIHSTTISAQALYLLSSSSSHLSRSVYGNVALSLLSNKHN